MKTTLNIVLVSVLLTLGFGCKKIDGTLDVNEEIKLKRWGKTHTYSPGQYESQAILSSQDKVTLEIGRKNFSFNVPDDTKVPRRNGTLFINSKDSGQPFDLFAELATNVERSETRRTTRSCTYTEPYTYCEYVPRQGERCWTEYRTYFGHQRVEYYVKTTDYSVTFELLRPGSDQNSAVFEGQERESTRVYTWRGRCR